MLGSHVVQEHDAVHITVLGVSLVELKLGHV
jgi:hypothetical protein